MATPSTADRGPEFRDFIIIMLIVEFLALMLRFASRAMLPKSARNIQSIRFWWDDFFALAASLVNVALFAMFIAMVDVGFGRHATALDSNSIAFISKVNWAGNFVYDVSLCLSKVAALLFLCRIFPRANNSKWFNWALWATFGLNIAWLIGAVLGTVFFCIPISKNWAPTEPGHCGTEFDLLMGSAISSVGLDLFILLLPLPKLWKLQISAQRRVGIMIVFILGYCVIIVSLGRLITVITSLSSITTDPTYQLVPPYYWAFAEVPITILSISLPAMMPLGRHLANNYLSPLASKISQLSMLSNSTNRTPQGTTKSSTANGPAWSESTDGIVLLPNDGASGFGDRTSKDSNPKNLPSRGLEETYTVTAEGLPPSQSRTAPQNAIQVEDHVSISSRHGTKGR